MRKKEKYYLGDKGIGLKAGDVIYFEMPPFCSGEYSAKIYEDEGGLYINGEDNYFDSARDGYVINKPIWSKNYGTPGTDGILPEGEEKAL